MLPGKPPSLEEVIRKGQERFKKEDEEITLTDEHKKFIEQCIMFFAGLFIGVTIGLLF